MERRQSDSGQPESKPPERRKSGSDIPHQNNNMGTEKLGKDSIPGEDQRQPNTRTQFNKLNVSAKDRWGRIKTTMNAVNHVQKKKLDRGDSFLRKFSTRHQAGDKIAPQLEDVQGPTVREKKHVTLSTLVIHPAGELLFYWLGVVTLSVMYNLWTCIAREAFREIQDGYGSVWFTLDAFCDLIYILDVVAQFRTGYLQQGLMVYESSKLYRNYIHNKCFIVDLVCLVPLDFLQFHIGIHAMLRFPRFLKIYRAVRFMHIYESRTAYPNLLRVSNLTHILFLGAHWFAAFYYLISEAEGFEGDWSYPKPEGNFAAVTRKYLASLYWSTLTLTTIGDLPPPDTNWQYVFVIVSYLIGVFIFATIVGQVGNVITNRNASRQEFERLLDGAKFYMQTHNVPTDLQKRVQRWYDYVWTRGRLNCNDINSLGLLPDKLKTELALHVNLETLKKVTIFQKCRPEFLHDLMLKMRAYIFTPGDLICRRGEVAREMFIIADGVVEIIGESATVLTQMSTGDFFGEIGILNLDGGINRRTADVRSVGYSELFVLSREDVLAALKDHPDAERIIREYGQRRLRETEEHRKMVRSAPNSPDPSVARKTVVNSPDCIVKRKSVKSKPESNSRSFLRLPHVHVKTRNPIPKLPNMSPKLRKVLNLKRKKGKRSGMKGSEDTSLTVDTLRSGSSDMTRDSSRLQCDSDDEMDYTKPRASSTQIDKSCLPKPQLNVIHERDAFSDGEVSDASAHVRKPAGEKETSKLADLVLNILRGKKQQEYLAVSADDNDSETGCSDFHKKTHTQTTEHDTCKRFADSDSEVEGKLEAPLLTKCSRDRQDPDKSENAKQIFSSQGISRNDLTAEQAPSRRPSRPNVPSTLVLPKIILTRDTNTPSCTNEEKDSSTEEDEESDPVSSSSDCEQVRHNKPDASSHRRTSLHLPSSFSRFNRRTSCPPPLDLPIEVPRASMFRGMPSAGSDTAAEMEKFKDVIDKRLSGLEKSYQATLQRLEQTAKNQEEMMKTILQQITSTQESKKSEGLLTPRRRQSSFTGRETEETHL